MGTRNEASRPWRHGLALLLSMVLALAGCGGGEGGGATDPGTASGAATIGAAGGSVVHASGARVDVPTEALATDTTIRIAQDGSGAPALPEGLAAAGSVYALTPHGTAFAQSVTVKIPAPSVALQSNQVLRLAKAEVDGAWQLIGSTEAGGMLSTQVIDFSYFLPVTVSYLQPVLTAQPWKLETVIVTGCSPSACSQPAAGSVDLTLSINTSGLQLPTQCLAGTGRVAVQSGTSVGMVQPAGANTYTARVTATQYSAGVMEVYVKVALQCDARTGGTFWIDSRMVNAGSWVNVSYPAMTLLPLPAQTQAVADTATRVKVVMLGGGAKVRNGLAASIDAPSATSTATVDWERSDDGGGSWRAVGRSFQFEGDPSPLGPAVARWLYTGMTHGFVAARSDNGALLRARACFTPPDATPPPCVTSNATQLVVVQSGGVPEISVPPTSVLVRTGQTASFSATAIGAPAPTLQWQSRAANSAGAWSDVAGATGSTYTTAALGLADNGRQIRVVASNAAGSVASTPVTVSVSDTDVAPTITTQPATLAVAAGGDAVFAVAARGTEALSYQWRFNGNTITGANAPVLRLAAVTNAQAGRYSVVVSNGAGSATSGEATLDVTAGTPVAVAPTIVTAPAAVTVNAGNTATFAVGVAGTAPYGYQWLKDGQPIEGATAAYYSLAAATTGSAGSYSVRVTNAAGSVTSAAASLNVVDAPTPVAVSITTQPSPQVQLPGGSATFAVAASGSGPIGYQWLKNGAPIPGATGAVLTLSGVTGSDAASYAVVVTNPLGSLTSDGATLTVLGAPAITAQPVARSAMAGSTATFSVSASGSALGYQWTRDGVAIAGANAASYTTAVLTEADSGSVYGVVVYNGAGVAISSGALLTVTAAPVASPAQARGKIAAAYLHTCAITAANAVACWGHNSSGQIGTGNVAARSTPYVWTLPEAAASVSAGATGSCAVTASGNVWCSGSPLNSIVPKQLSGFTGVRQVAVGQMHTCVLASDATVWCWGANGAGMLGNGDTAPSAIPVQVQAEFGGALTGVQTLQAGLTHTCATLDDYSTRCWGTNTSAQSGAGTAVETPRAHIVSGATYIDQLALGGRFSCGYSGESSAVLCWGLALDGSATTNPAPTSVFLYGPTAVGAGEAMACAIVTNDGEVACWGSGMMGNGNVNENQWTPALVSGLTGALAMAGGQGHSCVLRTGGSLVCWGSNSDYQIGTGDSVARTTPTEVIVAGGFWRP